MKKILSIISLAILTLTACNKEKLDGAAPVITPDAESLEAILGATLSLKGTVTAENGISSFTITNNTYGIDKSYSFEVAPVSYGFVCEFAVPEGGASDENILISVTDAAGKTSDCTVLVRFVRDVTSPVVSLDREVSLNADPSTGVASYTLSATFLDDQQLDHVTVSCPALGLSINEPLQGTSASWSCVIEDIAAGSYEIEMKVYDLTGNVTTETVSLTVALDSEPPSITMTSSSTAVLGEPYTLKLTITDASGIPKCWPKVSVYNENGTQPTEIKNNWGGWWPQVSGTETHASQLLTFTEAGTYSVWIDPIADNSGNTTEGKVWFTILVQ
jgi:hypothetical protein